MSSKARRAAAARMRAEANARRIAEQNLRVAVTWFGTLQEHWGRLTLAQIRDLSQLLADRADLLYRLADRVERGAAAPRLPKKRGLRQLADRVARVGREDDPVTRAVLAKLAELTGVSEQPRMTPRALRDLAIQVLADAQADLVERWAAIIKSSRARARKRPHQT